MRSTTPLNVDSAQLPRQRWIARQDLHQEVDEHPDLGRQAAAGGVDGANGQRAGGVVGQHDADRARGDLGRERPDRAVGQAEVGEHRGADLFGIGGAEVRPWVMQNGPRPVAELPRQRLSLSVSYGGTHGLFLWHVRFCHRSSV